MKLIADNLRITKTMVQAALEVKNPEPLQAIVTACEKNGAMAIDLNTGPLKKNPEKEMAFFIHAVEAVTTLPLMIDTASPAAMRAGLETATNPVMINGFSLEPRKLAQILPLAVQYNADIVGFLLYPDSRVPKGEDQRLDIALELLAQAQRAGLPLERLIIDPVVPPLTWDDGIAQARAVLRVIKILPELFGFPVRTIAGLSNLTSGAGRTPGKNAIEQSYATLLAAAGLEYLLMDVLNDHVRSSAVAADLLLTQEVFSWTGA